MVDRGPNVVAKGKHSFAVQPRRSQHDILKGCLEIVISQKKQNFIGRQKKKKKHLEPCLVKMWLAAGLCMKG